MGSLARLVGLRSTLVKDRPSFPQPDAGFVLAHEARSKGRPTVTYVTRDDLTAEKEALGVALLGAMAFAGALLVAPRYRRREEPVHDTGRDYDEPPRGDLAGSLRPDRA